MQNCVHILKLLDDRQEVKQVAYFKICMNFSKHHCLNTVYLTCANLCGSLIALVILSPSCHVLLSTCCSLCLECPFHFS